MTELEAPMEALQRLDADLRKASRTMNQDTVRYFVDCYYSIQEFRKSGANKTRAAAEDAEPHSLVLWVYESMRRLESDIQKALGEFTDEYLVGRWLRSITGIGPVISAGLMAHLDIRKAPTVGHFWRFGGYDPTVRWEKKHKRPWNADLKVLLFKMGDCFVKFSHHKDEYYGTIYNNRKDYESAKNEKGDYKDSATYILTGICPRCKPTDASEPPLKSEEPTAEREPVHLCDVCHGHTVVTPKKWGSDTEAKKHYLLGKLPPGHLHARALRYTSKMLLSHLHHVMHVDYYGKEPPKPFGLGLPGHSHYIPIPNWPWTGGGRSLKELFEAT